MTVRVSQEVGGWLWWLGFAGLWTICAAEATIGPCPHFRVIPRVKWFRPVTCLQNARWDRSTRGGQQRGTRSVVANYSERIHAVSVSTVL